MDQFEKQFVKMEVQAEIMESLMAGSTSLSTLEGEVNSWMQQVADDYGLEVSVGLPQFEKQFVNMEVQAEFMESSMAGSTLLSTPEGEVNSLMQQVADDYRLEVSVGMPQAAAQAILVKTTEKMDEDDLSWRLAELKAMG
ncbi:hypothetical protein Sjap_024318 [Stephania japonica]|uniref:Uncharacterized protein n=1 Tax=Stephania japonica TaxID=461633 RepID=A0AAP0HNU9_9MAGN